MQKDHCVEQSFDKLLFGGLESVSASIPCRYVTKLELGNKKKYRSRHVRK